MIAATAIPVIRRDAWWIRMFEFPRVQIVVISVGVLIAYWLTTEGLGAAGSVFVVALSALACCIRATQCTRRR